MLSSRASTWRCGWPPASDRMWPPCISRKSRERTSCLLRGSTGACRRTAGLVGPWSPGSPSSISPRSTVATRATRPLRSACVEMARIPPRPCGSSSGDCASTSSSGTLTIMRATTPPGDMRRPDIREPDTSAVSLQFLAKARLLKTRSRVPAAEPSSDGQVSDRDARSRSPVSSSAPCSTWSAGRSTSSPSPAQQGGACVRGDARRDGGTMSPTRPLRLQ